MGSHRRIHGKHHRHRNSTGSSSSSSCFRNPFVVFFVSFLALGSLRLRERKQPPSLPKQTRQTTKATRTFALRTRGGIGSLGDGKRPTASSSKDSHTLPPMVMASTSPRLAYKLVEEGRLQSGDAFRRYTIIDADANKAISILQWAKLLSMENNNKPGENYAEQLQRVLSQAPYEAYFFETKGATADSAVTEAMEFVLVDALALHRFAVGTVATQMSSSPMTNNNNHQLITITPPATFQTPLRSKPCTQQDEGSSNHQPSMGCAFDNLSGDARLVAPQPLPQDISTSPLLAAAASSQQRSMVAGSDLRVREDFYTMYSHLAAFVRYAPTDQVQSVLRLAARTYYQRLLQVPGGVASSNHNVQQRQRPVWFSTSGMGVPWLHFRLDQRPKYYTYAPFALHQQ